MNQPTERCLVCWRPAAALLRGEALGAPLSEVVQGNVRHWRPEQGLCQACCELFRAAQARLTTSEKVFRDGAYQILPTPLRVGADERFTGRGITMAFLDAGFYPHPDLAEPENRVLRYVNVYNEQAAADEFETPDVSSWHGMMTSVVAAGNGHLSGGFYRGIACDARVVLVKVGIASRIRPADIQRGLEWVIAHKDEYGIRVVNISCAGDDERPYLTDPLCQAAEAAVRAGLVVVCAVGNAGNTPNHAVLPPASSPSVISVGGFNDHNTLELADHELYQSSYGPTVDGLQKPEIIAPSILLAAPILPGTPTSDEAQLLAHLKDAPDGELRAILKAQAGVNAELDAAADLPLYLVRQLVAIKMHDANVINVGEGSYKHVDGTSFAAPIVAAVIAQMLEANPRLTPSQIKQILMETAIPLKDIAAERQGCGVVIPARAVERAMQT